MLNIEYDIFSGSKNVFLYIQRTDDQDENYDLITNTFFVIVNKHASPQKKFVRGDQVPIVTRNLRKESYTSNRFRNNFCKSLINKIK